MLAQKHIGRQNKEVLFLNFDSHLKQATGNPGTVGVTRKFDNMPRSVFFPWKVPFPYGKADSFKFK